MKRNRVFRLLASLTVVVLCMTAFSVTAFAGGGDGDYYTGEPVETTPEPTEEPATGGMEPMGVPLTPEGNTTLVDDYYGDKQLITVTTKAGNYFYILIDRANEDKETAVHFLNQVDEADLMALLEDGQTEEKPAACTCTEKCQAGAVNTACPVCAVNMSECAGKAPEVEPEPEPEPEKESGSGGALVLILLLLNLLFLIIGMLMEANAAIIMMTPILMPLLTLYGINPLMFGIVMSFNLCIGLVTPPVGLCLLLSNQIGETSLSKSLKALMPLLLISIVVLLLITYVDPLTTWLPSLLKK